MALRRSLTPAACALAAVLAACGHGESFAPRPGVPNPPRDTAGIRQLTLNGAGDWAPVFLDTGNVVGFSWRDPEHADHDRCVALMPIAQRRIDRRICHGGRQQRDSANAVFSMAFSGDGRVAYVEAEGKIAAMASHRVLAVRALDGTGDVREIISFPRNLNNGNAHDGAMDLAWTSDSTMAWVGTRIVYVTGVPEAVDTTETGVEIVRATLSPSGATSVIVVPNTAGVSTMAWDPVARVAYALFANHPDSVFTVDLVTGARALAIDLSALRPVYYITVRGGRLVASVLGAPAHRSGTLAMVDLPGGTPVLLPRIVDGSFHGSFFGRATLSPGRNAVVAEGFPYTMTPSNGIIDTTVSHASDLYLVAVP